jgi:hypothetical protein
MNLQAKAISMLPKGLILNLVQKQFEKKVEFKVSEASIRIDYLKNLFTLQITNSIENKNVAKTDKVTEFTDLSDILLNKVNDKLVSKKIDLIFIQIDFNKKETATKVFYVSKDNENLQITFNDLF